MPKTQNHKTESGRYVTIDGAFIRNEAREAVRQFFRPITAPFEMARPGLNQTESRRHDGEATKTPARR